MEIEKHTEAEDSADASFTKGTDGLTADNPNAEEGSDQNSVETSRRHPFSKREKILTVVAVVAVVAAICGFTLYGLLTPPADAAAKVDESYIMEDEVASRIAQLRVANSLEDDSDFASYLLSQNMNVGTYRQNIINELALSLVINTRAEELGMTPTDDEAQEQVDAAKSVYAMDDEDLWQQMLDDYNITDEDVLEQYRTNLAQQAICEAEVERREATDDELLEYMQLYLGDTTQKHAYRIVFTGDDATERAQECISELAQMAQNGTLSTESFSALAVEISDEDGVEETGGSYAWSGSYMADEAKEALEYVTAGSYTDPQYVEDDDSVEIFYVDSEYIFASADDMTSLPEDVPEELMDEVRDAAEEYVWESSCNSYLATLLGQADITYYPIPDDAAYNVDLLAASADEGYEEQG